MQVANIAPPRDNRKGSGLPLPLPQSLYRCPLNPLRGSLGPFRMEAKNIFHAYGAFERE